MTAKDLDALQAAINAALPDNTSREIDPADVRATGFIDSIDSLSGRIEITPQMFGALGDTDGTTGNGNNDTTAIQAASNFCDAINVAAPANSDIEPILLFPRVPGAGYRTTTTITVKRNIHVQMDADILYDTPASDTTICLDIGEAGVGIRNSEMSLHVRVKKIATLFSDWTSEGSIGIRFINAQTCELNVSIEGFTIGMQGFGASDGFSWNMIPIGRFFENKFHIDLFSDDLGNPDTAFSNQNMFSGGRIANSSAAMLNVSRYGFRIRSAPGDTQNNNRNLFIGNSVELNGSLTLQTGGEAIPFLMEDAVDNRILYCRNEGNIITNAGHPNFDTPLASVFAKIPAGSTSNMNTFDWTHTDAIIQEDGQASSSITQNDQTDYGRLRLLFDSGDLVANSGEYNATDTHVANLHVSSTAVSNNQIHLGSMPIAVDEEFTVNVGSDLILDTAHTRENGDIAFLTNSGGALPAGLPTTRTFVINANADDFQLATTPGGTPIVITDAGTGTHTYNSKNRWFEIALGRGIGRKVDTSTAKRFLVSQDTKPASSGDPLGFNGGRIAIRCFDSDGAQLDGAGLALDDDLIQGKKNDTYSWAATTFGGSYREGNDRSIDKYFTVKESVKSIDILLHIGTNPLVISRFRIYTLDTAADAKAFTDVYVEGFPGKRLVDGIPTTGVHFAGETVWLDPPTTGQPSYFECSVEGAPGTWLSSANLT